MNELNNREMIFFQRATDFMAIPITLNIVLVLANSLLIWSVIAEYKLLLWPWLVLYGLEWVGLMGLMVFLVIILFSSYMKVRFHFFVNIVFFVFKDENERTYVFAD